ncbi:MAG TPA: hypothetical protein VGD79_11435, partial [Thermoanaerobaculia bacterium]
LFAEQFHSNSIKYRDTSKPHATGRSGSATLAARALVNADGTADLQLTTGAFDPSSSRGNIDKVQLKSQSTRTIKDNHLTNDGTYAIHLDAVNRGQILNVQAHVSGIDGRRTDVVAVSEAAKLRPDLTVTSINAPGTALVNSPTLLSATVAELNGDLGARADCTLRVNGTTAATARGIWVDAGSTVSCSFLYTFANTGTANVEISARNVAPGDWDATNNAARVSVNVTSGELDMVRWAAASGESEWRSVNIADANWGYHSESRGSGWENNTYFSALWNELLDINTIHASYVESWDGETMIELRNMQLKRDDRAFQGHGPGQCMVGVSAQISAVICQRPAMNEEPYGPNRPAIVNPMFERRAGDVTYFQGEWGYDGPGGKYIENVYEGRDTYGLQTRLGTNIALEVIVGDATHTYVERPSYTVQHIRTQDEVSPRRCPNNYWCFEGSFYKSDKAGSETSPNF